MSALVLKITTTLVSGFAALFPGLVVSFYLAWKLVAVSLVIYGCRRHRIRYLWSCLYLVGVMPFMYIHNYRSWEAHPTRALVAVALTFYLAEFSFRNLGHKGWRSTLWGSLGVLLLIACF